MGNLFSKNKKTKKNKNKPSDKLETGGRDIGVNEYQKSSAMLPSTPPPEKPDFQALFDYERNGMEDISIKKNDLLKVLLSEYDF